LAKIFAMGYNKEIKNEENIIKSNTIQETILSFNDKDKELCRVKLLTEE